MYMTYTCILLTYALQILQKYVRNDARRSSSVVVCLIILCSAVVNEIVTVHLALMGLSDAKRRRISRHAIDTVTS